MNEFRSVSLVELSPSFSTRGRGAEAYESLLPLLNDGPVVLDLNGIEIMPASFLDGLLLRLVEGGYANDVCFMTEDARAKERLQRVSGLRGIEVFVCGPEGVLERLEPTLPQAPQVQFSSEKPDILVKEN